MVTDVSAIFVDKMILRHPSTARLKTFICSSFGKDENNGKICKLLKSKINEKEDK